MANAVNPKSGQTLREAIVDLYLNVKIRSSEEIARFSKEQYKEEKERLAEVDSFIVLDYIRSSVEIIMSLKMEDEEQSKASVGLSSSDHMGSMSEPPKVYESMLQKLEAEARSHIRVEQQLKLHIESMQQRMEEAEAKLKSQSSRIASHSEDTKKLQEEAKQKDRYVGQLEKELVVANSNASNLKKQVEALTRKYNSLRTHGENQKKCAETTYKRDQSLQKSHNAKSDWNKSRPFPEPTKSKEIFHIIRKSTDIGRLRQKLNTMQDEIKVTRAESRGLTERSNSLALAGTQHKTQSVVPSAALVNTHTAGASGTTGTVNASKGKQAIRDKRGSSTVKSDQLKYVLGKKSNKDNIENSRSTSVGKTRPKTSHAKSTTTAKGSTLTKH